MSSRHTRATSQYSSLPDLFGQSTPLKMDYPDKPGNDSSRGFSLIELSIVLVIMGLVVGGILAGQDLIRSAELKSITTEFSRYKQAVNTFQDQYLSLPGDMPDATDYWGRLNSGADCVTNSSAAVATPGACDGDGNGRIEAAGAASQAGEMFGFWRQLSSSDILDSTFSGIAGSGAASHSVAGTNVPRSSVNNAGWSVQYSAAISSDGSFFDGTYGNFMAFGTGTSNNMTFGRNLTPEEAWNIDTKVDDGLPAQGSVWSFWSSSCTTATSGAIVAAEYLLSDDGENCPLIFPEVF